MKTLSLLFFSLLVTSSLAGCNTMQTNDVAVACEQGINSLNTYLSRPTHQVHQANLSRANALLVAAQVQHQFAEYPGCIDKVERAKNYLSGERAAIISRLSI